MEPRFDALRRFYARLDKALPVSDALPAELAESSGNVCGDCFECCKLHLILTKHEFDCIEAYLKERDGHCPITWVTCTTPLQDARLRQPVDPDAHCPLFVKGSGCMAYEVRPVACRTFGPIHPGTTPLPATCVFTGSRACDSVEQLPLWPEYADVIRRNQPNPPGYFVARPQQAIP